MKLNAMEYSTLVNSRLVDLEGAIQTYKDNEPIVDNKRNLDALNWVVRRAEALLDAYEAKVEADEEETGEELDKKYELNMAAGLDEALNIRKGE